MENRNRKTCPICHRCVDNNEICCYCGYEFGSNRCSNPDCLNFCGDFIRFCPICGYETENYLNGDIGSTVATNVT